MIHNRYLPEWVHRLVNSLFVTCFWCAGFVYLGLMVPENSVLHTLSIAVLGTPVVFVVMLFVRRSFVRGVGGDVGYDELE